ncbi:MAG TPA: hypothetical protein VK983_04095 [Candidatus Limnocylindrales bacterium]|nr:hypothetical protein [Candidatus Limnocylindrales bacterium]
MTNLTLTYGSSPDSASKQALPKIYFSDYFGVNRKDIEMYGAIDISLIGDIPLFIDPFLIFESDKQDYKLLHQNIIDYLRFLKIMAPEAISSAGKRKAWFYFSEVEQNWLGFSNSSNRGAGLGEKFSQSLSSGLGKILGSVGDEKISSGTHLEKLCLLSEGIGRDRISDLTVNLIKGYLAEYTQSFAERYIEPNLLRDIVVNRANFDYRTLRWKPKVYKLPYYLEQEDYVLLTPSDMLTKDDTLINSSSFHSALSTLPNSIDNEQQRETINSYINSIMPEEPTLEEKRQVYRKAAKEYPVLIDIFIKQQEETGEKAISVSAAKVQYAEEIFIDNAKYAMAELTAKTSFYDPECKDKGNSFEEALRRVGILKQFIEDNDGYRCFYDGSGNRVHNESELQRLFKLIWLAHGNIYDINPETNHGRGPVDFTISYGANDKTYVEFKLASNSKLEQNLSKQIETYQKADIATLASKSIKVIMYFTQSEYTNTKSILNSLHINRSRGIILIDARNDNKPTGSNA